MRGAYTRVLVRVCSVNIVVSGHNICDNAPLLNVVRRAVSRSWQRCLWSLVEVLKQLLNSVSQHHGAIS